MNATEPEVFEAGHLPEGKLLRLNDWEVPGAWVLAGILILIGGLIALPLNGRSPGESISGLVLIGVGTMIAGVARSGLIVGPQGITVRELVRSRHWTWAEVDHFEVKTPLLRGALKIHLADGRVISTTGLDGRSSRERRLSKTWISELNRRASSVHS